MLRVDAKSMEAVPITYCLASPVTCHLLPVHVVRQSREAGSVVRRARSDPLPDAIKVAAREGGSGGTKRHGRAQTAGGGVLAEDCFEVVRLPFAGWDEGFEGRVAALFGRPAHEALGGDGADRGCVEMTVRRVARGAGARAFARRSQVVHVDRGPRRWVLARLGLSTAGDHEGKKKTRRHTRETYLGLEFVACRGSEQAGINTS